MMRHQISEAGKLAQLRALTDRQLTGLILNRLERGFALASRLESGDAGPYEELTQLVSEMARLLPVASRADRARLQYQFAQLQGVLESGMRLQAAS